MLFVSGIFGLTLDNEVDCDVVEIRVGIFDGFSISLCQNSIIGVITHDFAGVDDVHVVNVVSVVVRDDLELHSLWRKFLIRLELEVFAHLLKFDQRRILWAVQWLGLGALLHLLDWFSKLDLLLLHLLGHIFVNRIGLFLYDFLNLSNLLLFKDLFLHFLLLDFGLGELLFLWNHHWEWG